MAQNKIALCCLALTGILAAFTIGFFLGTERQNAVQAVQVSVRSVQELPAPAVTQSVEETSSDQPQALVNINTAAIHELQTLPGIGPVLAQRIIDYREAFGGFSTKEELMDVEDIGEGRYAELEALITVD